MLSKKSFTRGFEIASIYGLMPHELGFCGPQEANRQKILRKFLAGKISGKKIRKVLEKFEAAYAYYELIAKSNGIKDPFDEKVVEAYWLGNDLLEKVKIGDLRKVIREKFSRPGLLKKKSAKEKVLAVSSASKAHHSFHVFTIGSITGRVDLSAIRLKDVCRVGWGKVKNISNRGSRPEIIVHYQPITGKKIIKLGCYKKKKIIWDKSVMPKVKKGDWISFHWNCAVQVLTKKDIANLKKYTLTNLRSL